VAEHVEFRPDFKRNQEEGVAEPETGTETALNREPKLAAAAAGTDTELYPEEAEMVTF
jgi:hypothetical protein